MSWKAGIIERADHFLRLFNESRRLRPLPDDFYSNQHQYGHLHVSVHELDALYRYARQSVERIFGTESVEAKTLSQALQEARSRPYTSGDVFESYAHDLMVLKTTIMLMPENITRAQEARVTNIHIGGSVIGSTLAGGDASGNQSAGGNISIDKGAAKEALDLIKDLFANRNLSAADASSLADAKSGLEKVASGESSDPTLVQKAIDFVTGVGSKVLASVTTTAILDQLKRIVLPS